MATRSQFLREVIARYMNETGETDVDMHKVAQWAVQKGLKPPAEITPIDRLAKELSRAAREEMGKDPKTGNPYRVYHAVRQTTSSGQQMTLWVHIDQASRPSMKKSFVQRREQMVGDALQLSFDMDHWNGIHPDQEPIKLPLDFEDDVEWAKNAPKDDEESA